MCGDDYRDCMNLANSLYEQVLNACLGGRAVDSPKPPHTVRHTIKGMK